MAKQYNRPPEMVIDSSKSYTAIFKTAVSRYKIVADQAPIHHPSVVPAWRLKKTIPANPVFARQAKAPYSAMSNTGGA